MQKRCSLCDKIAMDRQLQLKEWERVDGLEGEEPVGDERFQRSIDVINQLQTEILGLELERRGGRLMMILGMTDMLVLNP